MRLEVQDGTSSTGPSASIDSDRAPAPKPLDAPWPEATGALAGRRPPYSPVVLAGTRRGSSNSPCSARTGACSSTCSTSSPQVGYSSAYFVAIPTISAARDPAPSRRSASTRVRGLPGARPPGVQARRRLDASCSCARSRSCSSSSSTASSRASGWLGWYVLGLAACWPSAASCPSSPAT